MSNAVQHIVSDPGFAFGKPRIAGTRFSVKDVVGHYLYEGMPLEVIAAKWHLPLAGVYAALSYYYDHKEAIDRSFDEDRAFVESLKQSRAALGEGSISQAGYA